MESNHRSPPFVATVARKGGVGKSTLTTFLAAIYARSGLRTCLVDLDAQASATRVLLGQRSVRARALGERLLKGESLNDLQVPSSIERLSIIPTDELLSVYESRLLSDPLGVTKIVRSLRALDHAAVDLVLVDTPPSLGPFTFGALMAASFALIPTLCEDSSVRTLGSALKTVTETRTVNPSLRVLGIVANRFERNTTHGATALETLRTAFGAQLARTVVPKAAAIAGAFQPGLTLHERAPAYQILVSLAEELIARMNDTEKVTTGTDGERQGELAGNDF